MNMVALGKSHALAVRVNLTLVRQNLGRLREFHELFQGKTGVQSLNFKVTEPGKMRQMDLMRWCPAIAS